MAYIDALTMLSGTVNPANNAMIGQTLTGSSPILSANVVDQLTADDGRAAKYQFHITQAIAGPTTVEMQLINADDAGMSANVTLIGTTGPIPVAQLTQGARFMANVNPNNTARGRRYAAARYVPTGGAISAGAVICVSVGDVSDPTKIHGFATSYSVI